ncbi:MAG: rhodanese-like domain-containing protein [bacterium]
MFSNKSKIIMPSVILLLFLTSSCITDPNEKENQVIKDMSAEEAYQLIQDNKTNDDFMIIDVRTESEFDQGHIQDAINIDYYSPDFTELLDDLDKNKTYLIYCRSGNRSGNTLNKMENLGFKEVYNLVGGINTWIEKGYPLAEECPVCSVENNVN